jgi:hypothetical protein
LRLAATALAAAGPLEALAGVFEQLAAGERQDHGWRHVVCEVGFELDIHHHGRLRHAIKAAATLAAAEQTSTDTEWLGAGGIMHEAATLHSTDHEIARTTRDGPRLGWQRHLAALPFT